MQKIVGSGWVVLALLAGVVAFLGGASRADAIQIIPLRGICSIFVVIALWEIRKSDLQGVGVLVGLFAGLILLTGAQVVPMPPSLWQHLPGRGAVFELDRLLGFTDHWRPLTLTPTRTWNALGSLIVPAAALVVALSFSNSSIVILRSVAVLGILNALLGTVQIASGGGGAFYFYGITNYGSPVGIFANENHAAIFSACSMLVIVSMWMRAHHLPRAPGWEKFAYPPAFLLILVVTLSGGSRAGFAAAIGSLIVSVLMLGMWSTRLKEGGDRGGLVSVWNQYSLATGALLFFLLSTASLFVWLDRSPAFEGILAKDSFADLRWSLLPVLREMLNVYWGLGAGFGSFEQVYQIHEPSSLLMPQYINQAHNDWLQLAIEGGMSAVFLLGALLVWIARKVVTLGRCAEGRVEAVFWLSVFTLLGLASLVDYPLRTPTFQFAVVWFLVALSRDARDIRVGSRHS